MKERLQDCCNLLTDQILEEACCLKGERYHPGGGGADEMDDKIKDLEHRIITMRLIREGIEDMEMGYPITLPRPVEKMSQQQIKDMLGVK